MNIYELTGMYLQLVEMLDNGATEEELADTFEALEGDIEAKLDNCMKIARGYISEAEAIEEEIKRLKERKQSCETNATKIKDRIEVCMRAMDAKSIKTAFNTFTIQKNPASVEVLGKVPKKFYIPQEPKLDKASLSKFLKENGDTKYAKLVQTESLRIR